MKIINISKYAVFTLIIGFTTSLFAINNVIAAKLTDSVPLKPTNSDRFGIATTPGLSIISIDDLPPEIAAKAKSVNEQYNNNGYYLTGNSETDRYTLSNMRKAFVPEEKVNAKLSPGLLQSKSKISELASNNSVFGALKLEGIIPSSKLSAATIYGLSRVYSLNDKSFFMIRETEFASGIAVAIPAEAINENVNGYPAILNIMKSVDGNALTTLSWFTDTKMYTITKSGIIKGKGRLNKLVEFAQTI